MKRKFALILTFVLALTLALCACGASNSTASSMAPVMETPAAVEMAKDSFYYASSPMAEGAGFPEMAREAGGSGGNPFGPDVKMIYRGDLELETTEFDRAHADLETLVGQLEGYFEEQSVRNYSSGYRYANYTVRVPAGKFKAFLNQVGEVCHVVYQTQSAEDITEFYYDTDARLQTARTKLERLQDLLSKADNMADIITIESAISETEYQIESLSGTLHHYDALVGYATISIELREVYRLTDVEEGPQTFSQQLGAAFRNGLEAFRDGLENLALWLAYHWLTLAVLAVIVVVLIGLVKRKGFKLPRRKGKTPPSDRDSQV